jgi:type IX secretion system PorP/SprF family membrane protein
MKPQKFFIATAVIVTAIIPMTGQDIHFSQFNMSPLLLNPALTGANAQTQATLQYKDQWRSVAIPYQTFAGSFDMKFSAIWKPDNPAQKTLFFNRATNKGLSAGISFFNDMAGDAKMGTLQGNLTLAYHTMISEKQSLGAGIIGGFGQRSINYSQLQWGNQYNGTSFDPNLSPRENFSTTRILYPDFGAGVLWHFGQEEMYITGNDMVKFDVGMALHHINQPRYSFFGTSEQLYRKFVAHATGFIGVKNTVLSFIPSIAYFRQGTAQEIMIGTYYRYKLRDESKYTGYVKGAAVSFGTHYRNKDAVILSTLFEMGQYSVGISYDINISGLTVASSGRGGIEIALRFVHPNPFLYQTKSRL